MRAALDKLTIKGFKSIRELEDFELRSLNIFIGANGSGKSNLVSFFRMLHALTDEHGQALDKFIRASGGVSGLLFNGRKTTKLMQFETRFDTRGYRFNIEPGPTETEWALTNEARYYSRGISKWWALGNSTDGKSRLVQEAIGNYSNSEYSLPVYNAIKSWRIYHFHDTSATAPMRHAEIIQDNKTLRHDAANIAPFLLRLRNEETAIYQEIRRTVQLAVPFFDDFLLEVESLGAQGEKKMTSLSWRAKGSDYPLQPYHLSDGSIRFICLAVALLQPNPPATLIIDEPELGLHPAAISILAELMQNASRRMQLIIATQSPALIDNFSVEDVVVVNRKDGASTFTRLKEQDYKAWLEDYSVGELWSKNVITGGPVHE